MESLALVPVPEIPGAGAGAGAGGGKVVDEVDENEEVLMNFEGCFLHPDLIEGILTVVRAVGTTSLPLFAQHTPTPLPPCLLILCSSHHVPVRSTTRRTRTCCWPSPSRTSPWAGTWRHLNII
jgi:hypothetical protein